MILNLILLAGILIASVLLVSQQLKILKLQAKITELIGKPIKRKIHFLNPGRLKGIIQLINEFIEESNSIVIKNQEMVKLRNDFLSQISHDIRTPLTSVIGYLYAIQDDYSQKKTLNSEYLEILITKSHVLKDRIDKLFEMAKLNSGDWSLHPETLDLSLLIGDILVDFLPVLKNYEVEINLPSSAKCHGDRLSLIRIITNLIQNVTVHSQKGRYLGITMKSTEDFHLLSIKDKNHAPLTSLIPDPAGGNGLGLTIVKMLSEQNNIELALDKTYKKGSSIQVRVKAVKTGDS